MQQQHQQQLDRGGFGGPPSYSSYAVGSAAGGNPSASQQQRQQLQQQQQQQQATVVHQMRSLHTSSASGLSETQGQHFGYQQGMTSQRSAYGNGQGQGGSLGGSAPPLMAGSNISNSDLSNPHQYQLMRNDVSAPMRGDSLQYDSQSFPSLSNGNSNGSGNRFSASSMQQIREDDFTMQNEDFPALPGSLHGDRNTQKLDDRGFSMSMGGGGMSGLGNSLSLQNDRLRESSQDSLQQQLVLQQQQHLLLQQQMRMGNQIQSQGQGQGHSFGPTISRGSSQHSVAVGGGDRQGLSQGGNNSLSGGAFSGLGAGALTGGIGGGTGVGGMGMGMGMGMLSLGQGSTSNANGVSSSVANPNGNGTLSSAALNLSSEGRFGLPGLLDVIRMTDKDLSTLALGSDLTSFGLNLNSSECLYSSFSSPFSDQPTSTEPQYTTPGCHLMQPPPLKPEHLMKFLMETLFYVFYSMPKDLLQACAAQELYRRDWRYHSELRLWMKMRSQLELMQAQANVQFLYFDVNGWEARPFTTQYRGNIMTGFLTDEEIRVKAPTHG